MGEEGLVFRRDEGIDQLARHLVGGHEEPALLGIFGQQRAVRRMDAGHHRRLVLRELLVVGKILRDVPDHIGKSGRSPEKEHEADREQPTEKPQHVAGFAPERLTAGA